MNRGQSISFSVLFSLHLLALQLAAQVSIAPASLTFQPQVVNSTSANQTVTVTNTGSSQLTVSSTAASGGYSVANNCSTLQPGFACTIEVAFISGLLGTTKGVLTITDSDHSSPQLVNLSGTTVPQLTLSPSSLSFGTIAVGASSPPRTLEITSNGAAFNVGAISTSGDYSQSNNCPPTFSAGQSCTVNLSFVPTSVGTINGAFSMSSRDVSMIGFSAALMGTGTGSVVSQVSIQPRQINFGAVGAFDFPKHSKTITLTNVSSNLSLTFQNISVTGANPLGIPDFEITSNTCKGMLAPGSQCQIKMTLEVSLVDPTIFPRSAPGAVTIVDSDATSPQVIGLAANILPELAFTPPTLVFSPQAVGTTSSTQIVTVSTNLVGEGGISLIPLTVSGDFQVDGSAGSHPCGFSPAFDPRGSCTLGVKFSPNQTGSISGAVSFTMYPECDPALVASGKPCPASQTIRLLGTGQ
jgi:hypothetical protein